MIPNTWRRTGDHYAHAREGTPGKMGCCHDDNARESTPERGDTRRHPRQRKGSFLPERMTGRFKVCYGLGRQKSGEKKWYDFWYG